MTNRAFELLRASPLLKSKFKPLAKFFNNDNLIEFRINRPGEVVLEYAGGKKEYKEVKELSLDHLVSLAMALADMTGQKYNQIRPILSTKLPGGHRVQINGYDTVTSGFSMTVRMRREMNFTLADFGFDDVTAGKILRAVKEKKTLIVSGGTGTGKTSLTNTLIKEIPADERIISIEDVQELNLDGHKDRLEFIYSSNATSTSKITANDLLRSSLRHNPDRILVGEIQNENALSFANAINTGHEGSIGTIHANSPEGAIISLLSKLVIGGAGDNALEMMQKQVCNDIYAVIQITKNDEGKRIGRFEEVAQFAENEEVRNKVQNQ